MPRSNLVLGALGALFLGLAALLGFALLSGSSAPRETPVRRVGPESIFEAEVQLHRDPVATLDTLRRLGVNRVRVYVAWSSLAPAANSPTRPPGFNAADPAAYPHSAWAIYDTIVRDARARRIGLDLTLGAPPPLWAAGPGDPGSPAHPQWRPSAREFGLFVRALGTRYGGGYRPPGAVSPLPRIGFWSIWNEPNFGPDLAPQTVGHSTIEASPLLYRGLLDTAWIALHGTGHAEDTILFGETAPAGQTFLGPGQFGDMVPLRFLRALYCVDSTYRPLRGTAAAERGCPMAAAGSARFAAAHPALFHAGGFADHPYSQGLAPDRPTPGEPDFAVLADLPRLERSLDRLQRVYGSSARLPIYSTEFGYQTTPPDAEPGAVRLALAANYLNWSEYLSWRDPRVSTYDQYLLVDPSAGNFATGLAFPNGVPKPTYAAYRFPIYLPVTSTTSGAPLEVWGCVRPAFYARLATRSPQRVQIEYRLSAGGAFRTLRTVTLTNPNGYFDARQQFPADGVVRLAWSYPHGPRIFSRTVGIRVH